MLPTPESIRKAIDAEVLRLAIAELEQKMPLSHGCVVARYVEGMREVSVFDIATCRYMCRHDWLDDDGELVTFFMPREEDARHTTLESLIAERRAQARELRKPTPDHHPVY